MNSRETNQKPEVSRQRVFPLFQLLSIALVCAIFIGLVLFMGIADMRTMKNALINRMVTRGFSLIDISRKNAEQYFRQLIQGERIDLIDNSDSFVDVDSFSLQESLVLNLEELTQEIDFALSNKEMDREKLLVFMKNEHLSSITILDIEGEKLLETNPIPQYLFQLATSIIKGKDEIKFELFDRSSKNGVRFLALRRKHGSGTIIITLDDVDWRFRCLKVAFQKATNEMVLQSKTLFLLLLDQENNIISRAGELGTHIQIEVGKPEFFKIFQGISREEIQLGDHQVIEISKGFVFANDFSVIARLGLDRKNIDNILLRNRTRILLSTMLITLISCLSMWFLYKNQNKHLIKIQEMEKKIQQAERLSALGRLAAGVAHEIRNPLNAIGMASQRLERERSNKLTKVIGKEIKRLNLIIEDFLSFSRTNRLKFKENDLVQCLREIILLMKEEASVRGVMIKLSSDDSHFAVIMDNDKLKQAFINIIKNSLESIVDEGSITIQVKQKGKEWVIITISDSGCGIKPEDIGSIFDPDFSTKDKGLGLGLPLAHEIIMGHGGELNINSRINMGTEVVIKLPFAT